MPSGVCAVMARLRLPTLVFEAPSPCAARPGREPAPVRAAEHAAMLPPDISQEVKGRDAARTGRGEKKESRKPYHK